MSKGNKILGASIKQLREARGKMSARQLAEAVGISVPFVYDIENGRTMPSVSTLSAIAKFFNVSTDYLMGRADQPEGTKKAPAPSERPEAMAKEKSNVILRREGRSIKVPVLSREMTACCGAGIGAFDVTNSPEEYIDWPRDSLRAYDDSRAPFAIYADGDCLESAGIDSGDKIVINPAETPSQGVIVLVSSYGMLSLKFLYQLPNGDVVLRCDQGERRLTPEEQEEAEFFVVGVMVGSYRPRPKAQPF